MNKQVSVKKNFIMNAILTMSSFIFPLITFPYVSTILSPSGYGVVQFALSVVTYFTMISQLGIPTYGIRACAQVRDDKEALSRTVHELLFISIIMSFISYILFFIALFTIPRLEQEKVLFFIVSFSILFSCIGMEWLYKGLEQYSYITYRSLFFKIIGIVLMFLFIHSKEDYVFYGFIAVFSGFASNIMNLINSRKYIQYKNLGDYHFKKHLKPIGIFFAMSVATTVYTHLDSVMLGFMKTDSDVGYYNAAIRIKVILVSVVTSLGAVLLPRASYYYENDDFKAFENITKKALTFVLLLAIPLMIYFILFAREGIYFLSSGEYTNSIQPMQILMPTLLLIGLTNIMGIQILVPIGKEKYVLYSVFAGAITDFIINLILIPSMAASGAAMGTLIAEFMVWVVQIYFTKEYVGEVYKKFHYISIGVAILIASVASISIRNFHFVSSLRMNSFIILSLSSIIFFGIYGMILTIRKEPMVIELENQLLSRFKKGE